MPKQPIRLTVLGSSTPYPGVDNPCSGYLVRSGATTLWMDAGTGTLGPLQQHVTLNDIDAICISHLHADHSADLLTAYYALVFADIDRSPIPLYGPPGIAERLTHYLTNGSAPAPLDRAFEVHELHDGHEALIGDLTVTARSVFHGIPAFGFRVANPTTSLVFSGDTAPCANLIDLAMDCDALLCEAESSVAPLDQPQVHHTPEDTGATAADSRSGRLIVTHVGRFLTPSDAVARAGTRYGGRIDYAAPGATFTVG